MKSLLPAPTRSTASALPEQRQKAAAGKQILTLALLLAPVSGAWAQQSVTISDDSQIGAAFSFPGQRFHVCGNGAITNPAALGDCTNLDPALDGNTVTIGPAVSYSSLNATGRLDYSTTANVVTASNNNLIVNADLPGTATFYGAYARGTANGLSATVTGNQVTIDSPTADATDAFAYGAFARTGTNGTASATGNQVTLIGGALRSATGGYATCDTGCTATTDASGNTVSITGGAGAALLGGRVWLGNNLTALNNTVAISGGTVGGQRIAGGSAQGASISATVSGNTVQISGGVVSNSSIIGGRTVDSSAATISNNTVEISGTAQIGAGVSLAGSEFNGTSASKTATGNTLKLSVSGVTVDAVSGFQNMNFTSPAALGNHGVMLYSNAAVDVSGVTLSVSVQPGSSLKVGDEIVLIQGPETPTPSITGTLTTDTITSPTTGYAFELVSIAGGSEENQLIVKVTDSPLVSFSCATACDIPASTTGTAITSLNVASLSTVAGGTAPYTFTATGLPTGLSISSAGVISGTPTAVTAAGTATITVTDSTAPTAQTASITIQYGAVTAPFTPLSFTTSASYNIPAMTVGTAITPIDVAMGAAGGTQPYTFSATGLPAGLSLNATTGVISGTPTTAGAGGSVTITVTDDAADSESITITYGAIAAPLTFTTRTTFNIPPTMAGTAITPVNVSAGVAGGQGPYSFSATGLPIGLSISSAGVISGTPSAAGPADTAIITVTDSTSPTPQTAHITISYGATASPTVTVGPQSGTLTPNGAAGTVTYRVTVAGIADGTYPVTLHGAPAGVTAENITLASGAGTLTLDAPAGLAAGTYTVTVTIDGVTSADFTFTVGALPSGSAAAIPTLSQWGLALLALLLAGGAAVRRRGRSALRVERGTLNAER